MVLFEVQQGLAKFLFQTTVDTPVEDASRACIAAHNIIGQVERLAFEIDRLCKHGPERPQDQWGLTPEQLAATGADAGASEGDSAADPLGKRTGVPPSDQACVTLRQTAQDALALVSSDLLTRRVPLDMAAITEAIRCIGGAVTMAYPMGLPEHDFIACSLRGEEDLDGTEASKYVFDVDTAVLWFAGKRMERGQGLTLSKYIGKNDKMKVKVKLTAKTAQAPAREPAVDEETKKKMMAYWHKKQEEEKKLAEVDDDAYMNSAWANPNAFKKNSHGIGNIMYR